ncbi:MAG: hypothetical protein JWO80_1054 [Bryobacterales bacterium]|nr:hypothetical protein [Bryobacterales bacterium]
MLWPLVGLIAITLPAAANVIATRGALDASLGTSAVTENFENLPVNSNDQIDPDSGFLLDSSTVALLNGAYLAGPGLVQPGIQFYSSAQLGWNGDAYFGLATRTLVSNSNDSTIQIFFTQPVNAFGLDLLAFQGYGDTAKVSILAPDQSTVTFTSGNITLSDSGSPVFFGYGDTAGIGGAVITQQISPWSPVIDNVTFGQTTEAAEPCSVMLFACGLALILVKTRRRQHRAG